MGHRKCSMKPALMMREANSYPSLMDECDCESQLFPFVIRDGNSYAVICRECKRRGQPGGIPSVAIWNWNKERRAV
jgi:hypothetical protein